MKKGALILLNSLALFLFAFRFVWQTIGAVWKSYYNLPVVMNSLLVWMLALCIYIIPLLAKSSRIQNNLSLFAQFWFARYTFTSTWSTYTFARETYDTVFDYIYRQFFETSEIVYETGMLPFASLKTYFKFWPVAIDTLLAVLVAIVLIVFLICYVCGMNKVQKSAISNSTATRSAREQAKEIAPQDAYERLNKLKALKDQEIIAEGEYNQKAAELSKYL